MNHPPYTNQSLKRLLSALLLCLLLTTGRAQETADGQWHDVLSDLNEYQAFEVVAAVGKKGAHSILHAIAVSTYGKSKSKITKTCGHFGWVRNKIDIRWTGSYFSYQLQVRTKSNYGEGVLIRYNIAKLI